VSRSLKTKMYRVLCIAGGCAGLRGRLQLHLLVMMYKDRRYQTVSMLRAWLAVCLRLR
jgi:hypothetical protein